MSSKAIAIANNLNKERVSQFLSTSPASSVSSSSGLYIPLHKRRTSMSRTDESFSSSSSSSSISSRPSSRAESHVESESGLGHYQHHHDTTHVYSREALLALAKSPLAAMPKEIKDGLRETVPEIVMSRKHRKAMEFRARSQQQLQLQITSHQKEMNASSEDPPRRHQQHSQEPRNRVVLQSQDPPADDPAQQPQSGQLRRQIRLHQPQREQHAVAAQPRANQQKRRIASSTGTSTRSRDADVNWRRTAGPPSITISAA